ncbi:hypothetical protein [Rheinheimera hassiensis]|uniref:hypothetical protein n=1 Tax=Rheinheimera hassiensis TaxID=1193627 RepID=UPI001F06F4BC|nr:hypothetical protein [Rheinheimera hassiensis]
MLFPAFSIGRTQELLYGLDAIIHHLRGQKIHQHLRWDELQIIVDSPLAAKFTQTYNELKNAWTARPNSFCAGVASRLTLPSDIL